MTDAQWEAYKAQLAYGYTPEGRDMKELMEELDKMATIEQLTEKDSE